LETLREQGLAERTLVILTSDNGGTASAVNHSLRGNKGSVWEGGIHVPTIAWWLGRIPAATATDAKAGMFVISPTFAASACGKTPVDRKIDAANLWPILAGEIVTTPPQETFIHCHRFRLEAVRQSDRKLYLDTSSGACPSGGTAN
jgi:arylsulfatase A-like enzyme